MKRPNRPQPSQTPPTSPLPSSQGVTGQGKPVPKPLEWWQMAHPTYGTHRVHVIRVWLERRRAVVETEDGERCVSCFDYLLPDPNPKGVRK
jgi:hypothetical protein